jgi:DNA-binding transcriptional ArsR family regulator
MQPISSAPLEMDAMRAAAFDACALLKTLANPDRLLLLCQLTQGEQCVGDLAARVGLQQPTLSQQLGVLRDEGLVHTRREGKRIFYRVANAPSLAVMQVLYSHFCQPQGTQA